MFQALLIATAFAVSVPTVPAACPALETVRSANVKNHFSLATFTNGKVYYETYAIDNTTRGCNCITTQKKDFNGTHYIDTFGLTCPGVPQRIVVNSPYRVTPIKAVSVNTYLNVEYPDVTVEVGPVVHGSYKWVLAFQCQEGFRGVQFYDSDKDGKNYKAMLAVFNSKLQKYFTEAPYSVNQTACQYQ